MRKQKLKISKNLSKLLMMNYLQMYVSHLVVTNYLELQTV
jgi:hypothetical protein